MKIAIVGSGLAGLTAAVDLVDSGHSVDIYESRSFWGGKVGRCGIVVTSLCKL